MPCTCNKKTTTLCPSESIEHKILNEARTFYTWVKTQFLALTGLVTPPSVAYAHELITLTTLNGDTFTVPAGTVAIVLDLSFTTGIGNSIDITAPNSAGTMSFYSQGLVTLPCRQHEAGTWQILNQTPAGADIGITLVSET